MTLFIVSILDYYLKKKNFLKYSDSLFLIKVRGAITECDGFHHRT